MIWCLLGLALAGDHVLLMGVGDYPDASPIPGDPPWPDLASAADLALLRGVALSQGVPASHITVLVDEQATRVGMVGALEALALRIEPGDRVWVHWSGHGQLLIDDDDEADGADEALVPWGAPQELPLTYDGALHLRDDDFSTLLGALRDRAGPMGAVVVTVDSCHSGGMRRGSGRGGPAQGGVRTSHEVLQLGGGVQTASLVVLAAATSTQIAGEVDGPHGRIGAFSLALGQSMADARSWREVYEGVRRRMARSAPTQQPVLDGDGGIGVFAARRGLRPEVRVRAVEGGTRLDAGALFGLVPGVRVAVGAREGTVVSATPWEAVTDLTEVRVGDQVEIQPGDQRLGVAFEGPAELQRALAARLRSDPWVGPGADLSLRWQDGWQPLGTRGTTETMARLRGRALRRHLGEPRTDEAVRVVVTLPERAAIGASVPIVVEHRGTQRAWVSLLAFAPDGTWTALDADTALRPGQTATLWRTRASAPTGVAEIYVVAASQPLHLERLTGGRVGSMRGLQAVSSVLCVASSAHRMVVTAE